MLHCKLLLPGLCLALCLSINAQETRKIIDNALVNKEMKADTSKKGPTKIGGIIAINLNQQNSSYWVGANEKYALNVGLSADVYANTTWAKSTWNNTLKMNYAWLNNQSQGVRKTADFIDLYSKYGRQLQPDGKLAIAAIANLRTQFTNGYDYAASPRRRTSGFFAPATALLTPGVEWRPAKAFTLFASPLAARWVIVSNDPFSYAFPGGIRPDGSRENPIASLYGVDPDQKVNSQFGAFVSASINTPLVKNVNYTSRIDLYSNYKNQPQNIDIFWTNNIIFKVNKWLGITYQFNIAYDHDFVPEGENGPRTQFLGNLGIGVTGKF
jgi:hypothetical protein